MAKNISKCLAGIGAAGILSGIFVPMVSGVESSQLFTVNLSSALTVSITRPDTTEEIDEVSASGNPDTFMTTSFQLNVATNNLTGYKATMTTLGNTTTLQHTTLGSSIDNLSDNSTRADFPVNHWGFSLDDSTYKPLQAQDTSTPSVVASKSAGPVDDHQQIYFGMKANDTKPSGDYSNTVLLTVVTNSAPEPTPDNPDNPDPGTNTTNNDNGANSAPARVASPSASSTESTTDNSSDDAYAKPQGVFEETDHDESINATNPAASAALGATAVVAAGVIFFVLAKRREDDEEEEEV